MIIKDIMYPLLASVRSDQSYEEVARFLQNENLTGAPVLDAKGTLVGVISEKDLFEVLFPLYTSYSSSPTQYKSKDREKKILDIKNDPITKFMKSNIVTAHVDDPIMKIGGIMLAKGLHTVPVVDENNHILGMVDRGDIYHKIFQEYLR
jgi:CBS-domain-containing membrane protein